MTTVKRDQHLTRDFRNGETRCRCRRHDCDAPPMTPGIMTKAQALRDIFGKPLLVTSGSRCALWNVAVGGAEDSQHLDGNALDLRPYDVADVPLLGRLAEKLGVHGIGLGKVFIHIDDGPPNRRWTYGAPANAN